MPQPQTNHPTRCVADTATNARGTPPPTTYPADTIATLPFDEYVDGVLAGDRRMLAKAITLVESCAPQHQPVAQQLLERLRPHAGRAIRIGVSGVPGAGKSSLIEALGSLLCARGHKLAVLAVDPSSSVSGGSLLGDKTRMERLAHDANAFIRPSPANGVLGGVARKTRETMLVFEAAGFDVIIVETVGVGQSEITVRSMVDVFLLLQIAGTGDELQSIKKGVMEHCDLIAVSKADGDNRPRAHAARADYQSIVNCLQPATDGWTTRALCCSAHTGEGLDALWASIEEFRANTTRSGVLTRRRRQQELEWMHTLLKEQLEREFFSDPGVREHLDPIEASVLRGHASPAGAAQRLLELRHDRRSPLVENAAANFSPSSSSRRTRPDPDSLREEHAC